MSRHRQRPPVAVFKPQHSRFANAPRTPEYNKAIWDGIKRFAPDKLPAMLNAAHDEAKLLNEERGCLRCQRELEGNEYEFCAQCRQDLDDLDGPGEA